jgi:AcrR family transcriptional regulator
MAAETTTAPAAIHPERCMISLPLKQQKLHLWQHLDKCKRNCFSEAMRKETQARPGGRSALVKNAVFDAVETLMAEVPDRLPSMGEIAARAGVNPTSLYRRWGNVSILATEVAIDRAMRDFPIPDTGTLRGDLTGWADVIARRLHRPENLSLLRVLMASLQANEPGQRERVTAIARRGEELNVVLARARDRGETPPKLGDVLEIVAAPIYFHVLFFGPIREAGYAGRMVDRLLALTAAEGADASKAKRRTSETATEKKRQRKRNAPLR